MLRQAAIVTSEKGRITECNPSAERLFGYSREELIGAGLYRLFLPDRPKEFAARISEHLNKHRCWIGKSTYFRKDQSRGRLSIEMVPYEENGTRGFLTLMRDISTEESATPESPSAGTSVDASGDPPAPGGHSPTISLHRARNDFQLLSSLLNMQSGAADPSADVREALRESRDRLGVLALVYRLISEKNGLVSFKRLAEELCRSIIVSENRSTAQISVAVDESSPEITQRLATTLGLILSELVSDVVSRSFPVGTSGRIRVGLEIGSEDGILILEDNGSLQSEDTRVWHRKSISGQVLSALVEQLRGTISYTNSMENQVRVRFKPML
jgi:PAS domain S-box-containing protein